MKKAAQYVLAVGIVALAHSALLFVSVMFAFMCSFGDGPQSGDVPRTKKEIARTESAKPLLHAGEWLGEKAVEVLKFPMATLDGPLPAFGGVWWLNSFMWGGFVVGGWVAFSAIQKKFNKA